MGIFTHLKLCLADAIHNFKWVKIIQIWLNGRQFFSNRVDWCHIMSLTCLKGGTECGNNWVKNPIYSAPAMKELNSAAWLCLRPWWCHKRTMIEWWLCLSLTPTPNTEHLYQTTPPDTSLFDLSLAKVWDVGQALNGRLMKYGSRPTLEQHWINVCLLGCHNSGYNQGIDIFLATTHAANFDGQFLDPAWFT